MTDLFAEQVGVDDFALDTDADQIALKNAKAAATEEAPAAVEEPATAEETPVEEVATDERLRNPDGTFAAKEPAEPVVEETPADKLYAGKYKSADELERAYQELQSLAGRQGSEVAELRQAFETRFAQFDERLNQPAAVQITQDLIDTNPGYAAQLAYEQNNGVAFQIAFEAWKADDPFTAATWATSKQSEDLVTEKTAALEARIAEFEQRMAPAAKDATERQQSAHVNAAVAEFPEIPALLESGRIAEIAQQFPGTIGAALLSADPAVKAEALKAAAGFDRGRQGETLKATTQEVARETAEQAQQAREEAFVASASTATSGVKPSRADEISAEWDEIDKPYNDGWQIG